MWAASAIWNSAPAELEQVCADLGVEHWPPLPVERGWAEGVWLALRWLVGEDGADAPMTLPRRSRGGAVLTAEELYERELAHAQSRSGEERQALHAEMKRIARRSRAVADLIHDTKRRLTSDPGVVKSASS
jgi:hypothetical protein